MKVRDDEENVKKNLHVGSCEEILAELESQPRRNEEMQWRMWQKIEKIRKLEEKKDENEKGGKKWIIDA